MRAVECNGTQLFAVAILAQVLKLDPRDPFLCEQCFDDPRHENDAQGDIRGVVSGMGNMRP